MYVRRRYLVINDKLRLRVAKHMDFVTKMTDVVLHCPTRVNVTVTARLRRFVWEDFCRWEPLFNLLAFFPGTTASGSLDKRRVCDDAASENEPSLYKATIENVE